MPVIQVQQTPTPIWSLIASGGGLPLLLVNLDLTAFITVGDSSVQPGDTSAQTIPPLGSISVPANQSWYAITDQDNGPLLQMTVGGGDWSPAPQDIAGTLIASGLAVEIAQAIAQSGVSLLAQPQLLYDLQASAPPLTGTLVGATIGSALNFGPYVGQGQAQNDTTFDGIMGRKMAKSAQKVYYQVGDPAGVAANILAVINDGAAIYASIKPAQTSSNTYANSTVTTTGQTCLQEKNNLTAQINNLLAAGLTTATLKVTLWQEPNTSSGFDTPAHYQNYLSYYGPAVRALGVPLVYNPVIGTVPWNGVSGKPTDSSYDEIVADFYGSGYNSGYRLDGTGPNDGGLSLEAAADNHTPSPCPFGLGEFNDVAGSGQGSTSYWAPYMAHLQSVFQARLSAGKPLSWLIFWMGNHANNKPLNQISSSADFKVPALQAFYDAMTTTVAGGNIPAGATVSILPSNPAVGTTDLAVANSLSYEITINLVAGIGSTVPFTTVQMFWYATNNPNAKPIATQYWSCPMGSNGTIGTNITGRGPQYGAYLRIKLHNLDSVACTASFQLNSNGRSVARDDWLWDVGSSVSVPTYSIAGATGQYGNQLASLSSTSVPANGSITLLLGMFSGPVTIRFTGGGNGKLNFVINPVPSQRFGTGALINETPADEFFTSPIYLPRGPLTVTINNSDTVSHNANVIITSYD